MSWSARERTPAEEAARTGSDHVRRALLLLDAAADGAGDEDVTPAEIAAEISSALVDAEGEPRRLLNEALDALSDGLPADDVATILRAALRRLEPGSAR